MKLKDRPLDWWIGKRFTYWCRADREDNRKIHYTIRWYEITGPRIEYATSDEPVSPLLMSLIRQSRITSLRLIDNEWHVSLDCL